MRKVLFIRFSSIGDIVLTTPVVRCLKKQVAGVEVHYLTKKSFHSVLKNNPYIDKLWLVDDDLSSVINELKQENFDFVSDLHHNIRSLRVRQSLECDAKAFNKLNIEKWLLVNFHINRLPETHIVFRYLETLSTFNVSYDGAGLDYFISESENINTGSLPEPWQNGFVAFVIGAKHATKRLPVGQMTAIITKLKLPVVLLGGSEDKVNGDELVQRCGTYVFNACGMFSLGKSASLVQKARLVITHDTGLMHIAAAFRKRIISIWGNTIPGFGMFPFLPHGEGENVIVERSGLSCRPCSKIGYEKCPKGHFKCMQEIDIERIVNQAAEWWHQPA